MHEKALNEDITAQREFKRLIERFNIKYAVETGADEGETTEFLCDLVERVYSVELDMAKFYFCMGRLRKRANITLVGGNSGVVLPQVIDDIPPDQLVLFYLDAHWYDYWPLLDEIDAVSKKRFDNAIVIIDDFKVPNRSLHFDVYEGVANDLGFIAPKMSQLSNKIFYYFTNKTQVLNPTRLRGGKIYIFPERLRERLTDFVVREGDFFYSNL